MSVFPDDVIIRFVFSCVVGMRVVVFLMSSGMECVLVKSTVLPKVCPTSCMIHCLERIIVVDLKAYDME